VSAGGGEAGGIETRALTKRYGGVTVVEAVTVRLAPGSKTALLGPNGSGKTTLLAMLSTLVAASEGEAWVAGHRVAENPAALRARIGVLGHSPMLYEELSALENLEFFARLYGVEDAAERIEELLRAVGLWLRRHDQTHVLSRGYHQRLAMARALLHRPDVLLLDEPETGLDAEGVAVLDELALRAPGVTVLAATHNAARAREWADGAVRLERGRVAEDTTAAGVASAVAAGMDR
jgi:heme exporter protein A